MKITIDKAIEKLKDILTFTKSGFAPSELDALQLGIEALEREKEYRHKLPPSHWDLLPGETEE